MLNEPNVERAECIARLKGQTNLAKLIEKLNAGSDIR